MYSFNVLIDRIQVDTRLDGEMMVDGSLVVRGWRLEVGEKWSKLADPGNAVFLCLRQEQKPMNVIHVLFL
jgi:hypothetical protein